MKKLVSRVIAGVAVAIFPLNVIGCGGGSAPTGTSPVNPGNQSYTLEVSPVAATTKMAVPVTVSGKLLVAGKALGDEPVELTATYANSTIAPEKRQLKTAPSDGSFSAVFTPRQVGKLTIAVAVPSRNLAKSVETTISEATPQPVFNLTVPPLAAEFKLGNEVSISGTVSADSKPAAGETIVVSADGAELVRGVSDPEGKFMLTFPPKKRGALNLTISVPTRNLTQTLTTEIRGYTSSIDAPGDLEFSEGDQPFEQEFSLGNDDTGGLPPSAKITFTLLDSQGNPVVNKDMDTDAEGTASNSLNGLAVGKYSYFASFSGNDTMEPVQTEKYTIDVLPNDNGGRSAKIRIKKIRRTRSAH